MPDFFHACAMRKKGGWRPKEREESVTRPHAPALNTAAAEIKSKLLPNYGLKAFMTIDLARDWWSTSWYHVLTLWESCPMYGYPWHSAAKATLSRVPWPQSFDPLGVDYARHAPLNLQARQPGG